MIFQQFALLTKTTSNGQYYNKISAVKGFMEGQQNLIQNPQNNVIETDQGESSSAPRLIMKINRKKKKIIKRIPPTIKEEDLKRTRFLNFEFKKLKENVRIPCFDERALRFPRKFSKKLKRAEQQSDKESDRAYTEEGVLHCKNLLKKAIKNKEKKDKEAEQQAKVP